MKRGEMGSALLEVIVALAILGTVGVAIVAQVRGAMLVTAGAERAETEISQASEFLAAIALWPRADLDRHLGDRRNGPWRLVVSRPTASTYEVTLRDSSGSRTLVSTTLYRGGDADAR